MFRPLPLYKTHTQVHTNRRNLIPFEFLHHNQHLLNGSFVFRSSGKKTRLYVLILNFIRNRLMRIGDCIFSQISFLFVFYVARCSSFALNKIVFLYSLLLIFWSPLSGAMPAQQSSKICNCFSFFSLSLSAHTVRAI